MFEEDLSVFLNDKEFAVRVQCDDPACTFTAIFDDEGSVSTAGGIRLENGKATLTCDRAVSKDFIWERTEVHVEGEGQFTVKCVHSAGGNMAVVELE